MKPIISVRNLSKKYIIGENIHGRGARTFRDIFDYKTKRLFRRGVKRSKEDTTIWALKDVSFDVDQGEVVGIIGRNGAGKSTLLKILSRITEPTEGEVTLRGRVASLLEVGTGFSGELTGRENIFLNGSILGMKKKEIRQKFDEIVAFAEVEKFIDTPVKRYSSGMYVRLAFAVAAHLEPEILLVDEVLAVGDAAFQKKCLGMMGDVAKEGRTVLFVSHNMPAIRYLTARSLLLEKGRLNLDASTVEVIDHYIATTAQGEKSDAQGLVDLRVHPGRLPGMIPSLQKMWMTDNNGNIVTMVPMGSAIVIHVEYAVEGIVRQPIVGLTFETSYGERVFGNNNKMAPGAKVIDGAPKAVLSCRIPRIPLVAGDYFVTVAFAKSVEANFDKIERAFKFTVLPVDVYGTGYIPMREDGMCILDSTWEFTSL